MIRYRAAAVGLNLTLVVTTLAACATPPAGQSGAGQSGADLSDAVSVVASTDVYGDIARKIGGPNVRVTSLIASPAQDPHSYEASVHDQLAVSRAQVIIENGGGYDDFMTHLTDSSERSGASVLNVVQLSGLKAHDGDLNEHVWYNVSTVRTLTSRLAAVLSTADPAHRAVFARNARTFTTHLAALQLGEASIAQCYRGTGVVITEPVPLYLLAASGLVNRTPQEFSADVESGDGVPVAVLHRTLALLTSRSVRLLVYNEQTRGPETEAVLTAAHKSGAAVVGVTETLPNDETYLTWMAANLAHVRAALASMTPS